MRGSNMTRLLVLVVFAVACLGGTLALTDKEILQFTTTGMKERNTGMSGKVSVTTTSRSHVFTSNGIPDHDTGTFPARFNPNSIKAQSHRFNIPKNPKIASKSTCLGMGPIGIAVNGVPFYNPMNAEGQNAGEVEVFDLCAGHPDPRGNYHYHIMPSCVFKDKPDQLLGVAFDGFPVYGPILKDGTVLDPSDLDECNGRTDKDGNYRYHATKEFPYLLGCFKGTVQRRQMGRCYFAYNTAKPSNGKGTTPKTFKATTKRPAPQKNGGKISTSNGNSKGAMCVFPFTYFGVQYKDCIMTGHTKPWCSTTANYDADKKWGECKADKGKYTCACTDRCCNYRERPSYFQKKNSPSTSSSQCCGCLACGHPGGPPGGRPNRPGVIG